MIDDLSTHAVADPAAGGSEAAAEERELLKSPLAEMETFEGLVGGKAPASPPSASANRTPTVLLRRRLRRRLLRWRRPGLVVVVVVVLRLLLLRRLSP